MDPATIISAVVGVGGLGTAIVALLKNRADANLKESEQRAKAKLEQDAQKHKSDLEANQQAFLLYKQMVVDLQSQVTKLVEDIRRVDAAHVDCEKTSAAQAGKIEVLQAKVDMMTNTVHPLLLAQSDNHKLIVSHLQKLLDKAGIAS